ncbi:M48 family metallopeptidase [Chloracidobacterium validum]|uniref:M48 family metallopeptidase n=1 Tax=Chloracidobacterium validum TaxID=2821543 RepID=A0ABX8B908_9BACT|nr:M48 family metallopeptidase [Chloracidobacterium validum]QUW02541.1 M48 family metallopeptidase [Chloracidobacterium validum]
MSPDDSLSNEPEPTSDEPTAPAAAGDDTEALPSAGETTPSADGATASSAVVTDGVAPVANGLPLREVRCRYCGQRNRVQSDWTPRAGVRCGRCRLPLDEQPHRKFPGLSPHEYIHPLDSQALNTLQVIPGIDPLLKKALEVTGESYLRVMFTANGVKVSEKQCADLHAKLEVACQTLGIQELPELYLSVTNPLGGGGLGFNAFTSGVERPFIVLFTPLVERLDDIEVLAVIAHELGHIHCSHLLYKVAAELLFQLGSYALSRAPLPPGIPDLLTWPIRSALLTWYQKAELSCDRAAQLVVQETHVLTKLMMKLAGGAMTSKLNHEEFITQARAFDQRNESSFVDRFWTWQIASGRTHPFPVWRVSEILKWTDSEEGYKKFMKPVALATTS